MPHVQPPLATPLATLSTSFLLLLAYIYGSSSNSHLISSHLSSSSRNKKKKKKKKQTLASRKTEMAPSFGRSISFPLSPAMSSASKARHVRSISLPCTSHPLLAHLHARIAALRSWLAHPAAPAAGLAHLHALHAALADLLLLPDPQAALRRATNGAVDRLLDAFLLLADAHQGFQEAVLQLTHCAAEARAALRRADDGRLASAARSQRSAEKELARLAASVSAGASKISRMGLVSGATTEEAEMAGALMEAAAASTAASAAVFTAAASMSSATFSCKKTTAFAAAFTKKAALETSEAALARLEQCIDECDCLSDKVFRSIVQTRVSMLNIMTPTI